MTGRGSTTTAEETLSTTDIAAGGTSGTEYQTGQEQHPLVEAGQQATESVGVLAERATNIGFQQADRARQQAAQGLESVSESIRRVSLDIEGEQPAIANVVTTAADQAEKIAEYLRTKDARQILSTVEDIARRQPLIFLGGAFVLGVAVSRLIKAAGGPSGQGGQRIGGQWDRSQQYRSGEWTAADYQATGPGGMGTDGLTGDGRTGEGI